MINSVSSTTPSTQVQQTQQRQQNVQAQNAKQQAQPQDTVVLSKQASKAGDAAQGDPDHDGH